MKTENKLELIHSELNAEYGDKTIADYALLGILKTLVTESSLDNLIRIKGWNK
jgi:hypothetical protein